MQRAYPAPQQPPLPPGWQLFIDNYTGRPFYWNHFTGETSWTPPSNPNPVPVSAPAPNTSGLPPGWEQAIDAEGRVYYLDHINKTSTWEDPRKKLATSQPQQTQVRPTTNTNFVPYPTSNPMMVSQPTPSINTPQRSPSTNYSYPAQSSSFGTKPVVSSYGSPPVNPNYMKAQELPKVDTSMVIASPATLATTKPTWDTTKENVNCQNCNVEFSFFRRRHHCRCCFRELCDNCTVKRSPVPQFGHKDAQRVCESCFSHLAKGESECMAKLVPYFATAEAGKALKELERLFKKVPTENVYQETININCVIALNELLLKNAQEDIRVTALAIFARIFEDAQSFGLVAQYGLLKTLLELLKDVGCTVEMKIEITKIFSLIFKDETIKVELKKLNGTNLLIDILGSSANERLQENTSLCIYTLVSKSEEMKKDIGDTGIAALVIYLSSQNNHILDSITNTLIEVSEIESCVKNMIDFGAVAALIALITPPAVTRINSSVLNNTLRLLVTLSKSQNACDLIATHETGLVALVHLLIDTQDDVQLENILTILFNISQFSHLNNKLNTIILSNALDPLTRLIPGTFPPVQGLALKLCASLADHQDFQTALRDIGAISEIMSVISAQNSNLSSALHLVRKICELNQANSLAVIEIGGLLMLLDLLQSPNEEIQTETLSCLAILCYYPKVREAIPSPEQLITVLCTMATSPSIQIVEIVLHILALVCTTDKARDTVLGTGKLPELVNYLNSQYPPIQKNAMNVIYVLCSSEQIESDKIREIVGDLGGMHAIIEGLSSVNEEMRDFSSKALREAARSYKNRENIMGIGGIHAMVDLMKPSAKVKLDPACIGRIAEVIAAFSVDEKCRGAIKDAGALPLIIESLYNESTQLNAVLMLSNFTLDDEFIEEIHNLGGVQSLIPLLSSEDVRVQEFTMQSIANLAKSAQVRYTIIHSDGVPAIFAFLTPQTPSLQLKAIYCLTLLSLQPELGQIVMNMPQAISALGALLEIPQALFVMMNLIHSNPNVFEFLVNTAGIPALLVMINSNNSDAQSLASSQLAKMSSVEEFKLQIMHANNNTGLMSVVNLLGNSERHLQETGVAILANISAIGASHEIISPAISQIVALLSSPKYDVQLASLEILKNVSTSDTILQRIVEAQGIPKFIDLMFCENEEIIKLVMIIVKRMSEIQRFAEILQNSGVVLSLITLLDHKNEEILETVISILGSQARSSSSCRTFIVENNLKTLIPLLLSHNKKIQTESLYLTFLLSSNAQFCHSLISMGGLDHLLKLFETNGSYVVKIYVNVSAVDNNARRAINASGALPVIIAMLRKSLSLLEDGETVSKEMQSDLINLLKNLSLENKDLIRESGGIPLILQVLTEKSAIETVLNLSLSSVNRQILYEHGVVEKMFGFLLSQDKKLVLTVLTIIDIMSFYEPARKQIGEFSIVPVLTRLLGVEDEELQLKCLYLLRNISYYDPTGEEFVKNKGVEELVKILHISTVPVQLQVLMLLSQLIIYDEVRKVLVPMLDEAILTRISANAVLANATLNLRQLLGL